MHYYNVLAIYCFVENQLIQEYISARVISMQLMLQFDYCEDIQTCMYVDVYTCMHGRDSLKKEGELMRLFGTYEHQRGQLHIPCGIAATRDGFVIVTSHHKVSIFKTDRKFVQEIAQKARVMGLALCTAHLAL